MLFLGKAVGTCPISATGARSKFTANAYRHRSEDVACVVGASVVGARSPWEEDSNRIS